MFLHRAGTASREKREKKYRYETLSNSPSSSLPSLPSILFVSFPCRGVSSPNSARESRWAAGPGRARGRQTDHGPWYSAVAKILRYSVIGHAMWAYWLRNGMSQKRRGGMVSSRPRSCGIRPTSDSVSPCIFSMQHCDLIGGNHHCVLWRQYAMSQMKWLQDRSL